MADVNLSVGSSNVLKQYSGYHPGQYINFYCSYNSSGVLTVRLNLSLTGSWTWNSSNSAAWINFNSSSVGTKWTGASKQLSAGNHNLMSKTGTYTAAQTITVYAKVAVNSGTYGPTGDYGGTYSDTWWDPNNPPSNAKTNGGGRCFKFTISVPGTYTVPGAGTTSCSMSNGTFTITWSGFTNGTNNAITTYELWYQESTNNSTWSNRARVPGYTNRLSPRSFTTTFGTVGRYYRFCAVALGTVSGTYSNTNAWGNSVRKTAGKLSAPTWKTSSGISFLGNLGGGTGEITVSWNAVSSATSNTISSYDVQACYPGGTWYSKGTTSSTSMKLVFDGYRDSLCPIQLRIQARGSAGSSYYSNYSSTITVYAMNADVHIYSDGEWKAGKVWIYNNGWKRAENVFVYSGGSWKHGISTK